MSAVRSRHCRQPRSLCNPDPAELRQAMARFLPHRGLPLIAAKANQRWGDRLLVYCAILLSWADATRLKDRFELALAALKQMFPSRRCPGASPQGFIRALVRHSQRLITVVDPRNRRMHLLSSVLETQRLSDAEAAALYGKRWGVELIYRSLKQTMGRRRMVSRSPESAAAELNWAIVGLWLLGLMSVSQIIAAGQMPERWSVAMSLRQVRRAASGRGRGVPLSRRLAEATVDNYQRNGSKKSRHWPHEKRENPPGEPKSRWASELEVQLAQELARHTAAA